MIDSPRTKTPSLRGARRACRNSASMSGGPKTQLASHGLIPKRSFGQNFLTDPGVAARIADLAVPRGGTVIEVGAGLGALTRPLLERADRVIAVERDRDLVPILSTEFSDQLAAGRLNVVEADAKNLDLAQVFAGCPRPYGLCGNIPYSITGALFRMATESARIVERVVFLVQMEVARRVAAIPASAEYGALSVFVQAAFETSRPLLVRRGAFYPSPKVDSAVVVLVPRTEPVAESQVFAALVRGAFGQRRKKLANSWRTALNWDGAKLSRVARQAGIDLNDRGERLTVADFARMAEAVEEQSEP